MPERTSAVHRYSGATTSSGEEVLCASCAALRTPPLTQHEAVTSVCSDCEKKYRGVWSRWQPLLATQTSSEDPTPSVDELRRFVADAKIAFNDVVFQKGHPDVYLVNQGGRRIAFPCVRLDLVRERQPLSRWRPILQSCKWFMPAFIRGGELDRWYTLWHASDAETTASFDVLMRELYTRRRQVQSVCSYHDLREFKKFRHTIMDAAKAAHLGLYHASTSTLVAVAEAILRELESTLGLGPTKNNVRQMVENVFQAAFARIKSFRGHGYHWIPEEYDTLQFMAQHDHLFLFLLLFKDFLLMQLFASTDDIDPADGQIINRHAILHGIAPPRGLVIDTIKLIGVLDGLACVVGYVTEQSFTLYGSLHEARDAQGGVVNQPSSSIDAVEQVFQTLESVRDDPRWKALDQRASQILEEIAVNGTVVRQQ